MHPRDRLSWKAKYIKNVLEDEADFIKQVPMHPRDRLRQKVKQVSIHPSKRLIRKKTQKKI